MEVLSSDIKMSIMYIFLYCFYQDVEKSADKLLYGNTRVIWTTIYIMILALYVHFAQNVLNKMRKYSLPCGYFIYFIYFDYLFVY